MNIAGLHVMIVDDDPSTLAVYGALLQAEGHTISTRDRALGTAPAIISARPNLVLLDINMPGLNGPDIVRLFRDRKGAWSPLFVLFASGDQGELQQVAHQCGAAAALSKNLDHHAFLIGFRTILVQHLARPGV